MPRLAIFAFACFAALVAAAPQPASTETVSVDAKAPPAEPPAKGQPTVESVVHSTATLAGSETLGRLTDAFVQHAKVVASQNRLSYGAEKKEHTLAADAADAPVGAAALLGFRAGAEDEIDSYADSGEDVARAGVAGEGADAGADASGDEVEDEEDLAPAVLAELGGALDADAELDAGLDAADAADEELAAKADAEADALVKAAPSSAAPPRATPAAKPATAVAAAATAAAAAAAPAASAAAAAVGKAKGKATGGNLTAAAEGGELTLEPAPGQGDKAIRVRSPARVFKTNTLEFLGTHSYNEDLGALLGEVDEAEAKAKLLRLRIVEKENFLESLDKRRALITEDIKADKASVSALSAHRLALEARVRRIKKERAAAELRAQEHQYIAAGRKLESEAQAIQAVGKALGARISSLRAAVEPLVEREQSEMRKSILLDGAPKAEAHVTQASSTAGSSGADGGAAVKGGPPSPSASVSGASPAAAPSAAVPVPASSGGSAAATAAASGAAPAATVSSPPPAAAPTAANGSASASPSFSDAGLRSSEEAEATAEGASAHALPARAKQPSSSDTLLLQFQGRIARRQSRGGLRAARA